MLIGVQPRKLLLPRLILALACAAAPARAQVPELFGELHQLFPSGSNDIDALASGDVDGDGDDDLVLGSLGEQSRLYLNSGGGMFVDATATHLPSLVAYTKAVGLADMDGDGDADLVLGNSGGLVPGSGQERLYLNDGTGHFADVTASHLPATFDPTTSLVLGDLDSDGDRDLITGNSVFFGSAYPDLLYTNDGTGHLASASGLPGDPFPAQALALADVDGDLDLDLVAGNGWAPGAAQNKLFLNDGSAAFVDATDTHMPLLWDSTYSLALGDVDTDGDPDLAVGNDDGPDSLYLNDGAGHFSAGPSLPTDVSGQTRALALGDVDGDGDPDLVLGQGFGDVQDRLFENDGAGHFVDVTAAGLPAIQDDTRALLLTDLNGDGDRDLVVGNSDQSSFLHHNDGAGHFTSFASLKFPGSAGVVAGRVAVADLDGDGDRDAFTSGLPGNFLFLNDGTGFFENATAAKLPVMSPWGGALALADVDGDGDQDLATGVALQPDTLFLNDGTAQFADATATHMPVDHAQTTSFAFGDVDGDGDPDLVAGKVGILGGGAPNRLCMNDGAGHFTAALGSLPALLDVTADVGLADVDGDSDLDLVFGEAKYPGDQDRLLLNDGTGHFTDATATHFPSVLEQTSSLALGDVDVDGDCDVIAGSSHDDGSGAQNRLYLNGGSGVFSNATATHLPALLGRTFDLALGDADGDGDPDLAMANEAEDWLWRNDGTGHFVDATSPHLPWQAELTNAVALADLDSDGDQDLLLGGENFLRLVSNLRSQLAWHNLPVIGAPLVMDLYGVPSDPWVLAYSFAAAEIPLPPFGTLQLDPAFLHIGQAGVLDADGTASAAFSIPGHPGLIGVAVQWQALLGAPYQLTNRERTTFGKL